jgi:uncharacterized protein HemX
MVDVAAPSLVQIASALGAGGFATALLGHLFGWRKNRAEEQATLQGIVDERLKSLLASDENRLKQMSEALEGQSRTISELQRTIADQSERMSHLEATVKTQSRHIVNLEKLLRAQNVEPPARPFGPATKA